MHLASTMIRRTASFVLALAMALSLTPIQPAAAAGCSISGTIVDAKTGGPVWCRIYVYKLVSHWDPVGGSGQSWQAVAKTDTWSGKWTISKYTTSDLPEIIDSAPDLPPGTYRVSFVPRSGDYIAEVYDNVIDGDLWAGKNVVVHAGEAVTGIDAALSDGWGYAGGTITDAETGLPVAGIEAELQYWSPSLNDWQAWTAGESGAAGTFKTGRAPEGTYRVHYRDTLGRYADSYFPGTPVEADAQTVVIDANRTTNCPVALQKRSVLSGRVTDPVTGAGLGDIEVSAYRRDPARDMWWYDATAYTTADGAYALRVNGSGEYRIEYRDWSGSYEVRSDDFVTYYPGASTLQSGLTIACAANTSLGGLDATVTPSPSARVARVVGSSTYDRSAALSAQTFAASRTPSAVLVNPRRLGPVTAAPALAGALSGPVLYTSSASVPASVLRELERLGTRRVYIVGSTDSVNSTVVNTLRSRGIRVVRVSGADHAATTAAVLRTVKSLTGSRFGRRVIVVRGSRPTDIGAATALAYRLRAPIVLSGRDSVPSSVSRAMRDTGVRSAVLVGSSSSLSGKLVRRLSSARISSIRRSGSTPAATAYSLSSYAISKGYATYGTVAVAGSAAGDLPEVALAGSYAGRRKGVLLLTTPITVPSPTAGVLSARKGAITRMRVVASQTQVQSAGLVRLSNAIY